MVDATQLEADLLAALGVSMPEPDKLAATSTATDAPQPRPQSQPARDVVPEPLSVPTAPETPSQALDSASSTIAAPVSAPLTPPPPSAPEPLPPPELDAKISSSSPVQLVELLEPSAIEAALQGHPQTVPVSAPSSAPVSAPASASVPAPVPPPPERAEVRSPKRPRSPDHTDEASIKRLKTDQAEQKEEKGAEPSNLDLAALLNNALASFDQQANPGGSDAIMQDADAAQAAAPPSTTPEVEKPENKIVKASSNPFLIMRSMSLPVLGNIAVQILLRLSQQPRAETERLLADGESEFRKSYDMLRDIFRSTRRAFSDSALLSPDELDITDSEDRETIRMSNLAATAASGFGAHDVPLQDVHDAFFSIFIPEDGEYRASLTELFVCLKTRLLLDALGRPEQAQPVAQLLDTLFPANIDQVLKQRSGDPVLSADEERLVSQVRERRELLVKSAADESIKKSLEEQSSTDKLVESLSNILQGHLGVVVDYAEKYGVNIPLNEEEMVNGRDANSIQPQEDDGLAALLQSATSHLVQTDEGGLDHSENALSGGPVSETTGSLEDGLDLKKLIEQSLSSHIPELKATPADHQTSNGISDIDSKNLASLISEKLKSEFETPTHGLPGLSASDNTPPASNSQYMAQLNHAHPPPYQPYSQNSTSAPPIGTAGEILPPNQSLPTAALYEKARQAAVAKSSNTTRREGLHSTRRPWTPEEEKALMAGLDMVKGPHWSQILSLFGQNGTVSDILKDRTQVQLKDKARNLKLFFLKTNSEMPYYLQSVTGELKTRAPSQAARKEAEEKARLNAEEEQARFQGIVTLAGGLQNNHHPITSSPLTASPVPRASPVAPAVGGVSTSATATAGHVSTSTDPVLPPVPISPVVKTEPSGHHSLHKITAFPPIQPAPAPVPPTQHALKPQLPPLQPQPNSQHQQPKQQSQQPQKPPLHPQYQQQQQELQRLQQQRHALPQQPQAQLSPHPPPQPSSQTQPNPQPSSQTQPNPQPQAPTPAEAPAGVPAQVLAAAPPPASIPAQAAVQTPKPPQPTTGSRAPEQLSISSQVQSQPQPQQQQQKQQQPQQQQQQQPSQPTPANNVHNPPPPAFTLPPIPPNHHSTPDHAQDTKLFETLQAAIAASSASEPQAAPPPPPPPPPTPVAAASERTARSVN